MSELVEYKGLAIIVVFASLFVLERLLPKAPNVMYPIKRLVKNLMFWPLNIVLSLVVILPVSFAATQFALWERPDWALGAVGVIFDILMLDLFIFWWHRAVHEIPFLWRFHEVHHMDEHLDTSSAIRFHFGEIFFATFARVIVVMAFAIPFTSIVVFEALVLMFVLFHHSNLKLPVWLEHGVSRVIVTPSLHWVHHHAIRKDTDSNYGTIFSFWDVIFKTKSHTARFDGMPIGVEGLKDQGIGKLVIRPFKKLMCLVICFGALSVAVTGQSYAGDVEGVAYVSPKEAHELIQDDADIIVLDIRTPREFSRDHIEGAINHNYFSFGFKESLKTLDPNKKYLVHCAAGYRSQWALNALKDAGITDIVHMDYGLNAWREQGLLLSKP